MPLKHLLLHNGDGGGLTAAVVARSRITAEDANTSIGGQARIDIADGCEKVRVDGMVPDSVGRLGCGLPDLLQLGPGYVLTSDVTVKSRLLRRAAELDHDRPHFFREIGMAN